MSSAIFYLSCSKVWQVWLLEHMLRVLADTGANSSIILVAYTSAPFINTVDSNTNTWSITGAQFTTANIMKQMCSSWEFHVDNQFESSITYDLIITS
jgi:hypothetical protein